MEQKLYICYTRNIEIMDLEVRKHHFIRTVQY